VIHLASFLGQKKKEIMRGLNILNAFFRDVLVCKETGENNRAINQDSASLIAAYARRLSGEQILQNMEQIEKTGMMIEQNVNKSLTLEAMAFKLNY
jgi:DNA polymerase-3 subunit delta'